MTNDFENRPPPFMNDPAETARIQKLRDALKAIWGDGDRDVIGISEGPNGEMQIVLSALKNAGDGK